MAPRKVDRASKLDLSGHMIWFLGLERSLTAWERSLVPIVWMLIDGERAVTGSQESNM